VFVVEEGLPAGHDDRAKLELRASDEDRERVVEVLRVAAGDGRLTVSELDERLERALTARTSGELVALTADLPELGAASVAKEVVRLDVQGGKARRRGKWMVPRRMEIRGSGGSVKLDFTAAVITFPTLDIQAEVRGGRLVLVSRPGIEVDVGDMAARGGRVTVRPERGAKAGQADQDRPEDKVVSERFLRRGGSAGSALPGWGPCDSAGGIQAF
jgi:uncharacterized protein DUF1707